MTGGAVPDPGLHRAALAAYIESCPPSLHAGCPHRRVENDEPSCGRECEADLAVLEAPRFDAGEVASEDAGQPDISWRPVSLLRFVAEHLPTNAFLRQPRQIFVPELSQFKRQVFLTSALDALVASGVDPAWLVRGGIGHEVVDGTIAAAAMGYADKHTGGEMPTPVRFLADRLDEAIGPPGAGLSRSAIFAEALVRLGESTFESKLAGWLATSTIQAVALWWLPLDEAKWADCSSVPRTAPDLEAIWLVDRMTKTYLDEWRVSSLHIEVRWQRGDFDSSLPDWLLRLRVERMDDLACELARRADGPEQDQHRVGYGLASTQRIASNLLADGQPGLAATLFEQALLLAPTNRRARLLNNLGFCMLPDDPVEATVKFQEALEGGFEEPVVYCNLGLAASIAGKHEEARGHFETALSMKPQEALLWEPLHDEWELIDTTTMEYAERRLRELD